MVQRAKTLALVEEASTHKTTGLRVAVLTLANRPIGELREMGASMDEGLKNLRRTKAWKQHVVGAKLAFEITGSEEAGWHQHANLIFEGFYWPQEGLSRAWREATRGAGEIVWIEALQRKGQTLEQGVREAVKYFVKFREAEEKWNAAMKAEFRRWANGRAFYRTYGAWRKLSGAMEQLSPVEEAAMLAHREGGCPQCKTVHGWEISKEAPFIQATDLAAFGYARFGHGPVPGPPECPPVLRPCVEDLARIDDEDAKRKDAAMRESRRVETCAEDRENLWMEGEGP